MPSAYAENLNTDRRGSQAQAIKSLLVHKAPEGMKSIHKPCESKAVSQGSDRLNKSSLRGSFALLVEVSTVVASLIVDQVDAIVFLV